MIESYFAAQNTGYAEVSLEDPHWAVEARTEPEERSVGGKHGLSA